MFSHNSHPDGDRADYPLNRLYVYLTEGCNLACRHCWLSPGFDPHGTRYPVLELAALETVLDEAMPLGLSSVKLTGGEPLLHPRIEDVLRCLQDAAVGLNVETNGLLLTDRLAGRIADFSDRFVSVSIDGADPETHDRFRGAAGAFEGACQAVTRLVDSGIRPQVIMAVTRKNCDQIPAMIRLAESMGASSVKLNPIHPIARGEVLVKGDETLTVGELIRLCRYVEGELARQTELPVDFDIPPAFRPLSRLHDREAPGTCGILGILGLLPTGEYALCGIGRHIPGLVFGRVGEDPLKAIWDHHSVLVALRAGLPRQLEGICGQCLMRGRCLGSCIAQNQYRTGRLFGPFWFCEAAFAAGLFPRTRFIPDNPSERR